MFKYYFLFNVTSYHDTKISSLFTIIIQDAASYFFY